MALGDRLRGFADNIRSKVATIGDKLRGRFDEAKRTVGEIIQRTPGAIEDAIAFAKKQAISISEGVGDVGYNVVSRTGKGVAETAGGIFNSSIWTAPTIIGGLVVAGLIATKL